MSSLRFVMRKRERISTGIRDCWMENFLRPSVAVSDSPVSACSFSIRHISVKSRLQYGQKRLIERQ